MSQGYTEAGRALTIVQLGCRTAISSGRSRGTCPCEAGPSGVTRKRRNPIAALGPNLPGDCCALGPSLTPRTTSLMVSEERFPFNSLKLIKDSEHSNTHCTYFLRNETSLFMFYTSLLKGVSVISHLCILVPEAKVISINYCRCKFTNLIDESCVHQPYIKTADTKSDQC